MSNREMSPETATTESSRPDRRPPRAGTVALVAALVAVVFTWATSFLTPVIVTQTVARGDYQNVFMFPAIAWGVIIVLELVAVVAGIMGLRTPNGRARSGAALALGATGILGFLLKFAAYLLSAGLP